MNRLRREAFEAWMDAYGRASREDDPGASAELFTEEAQYHENPFDEPLTGRPAIFKYWAKGARTLKDKETSYEILSIDGSRGIARWKSEFTSIESGKRFALDCIFVVEFDEADKCHLFREWWHIKPS